MYIPCAYCDACFRIFSVLHSWIEARDSPGTLVSGRYEITIAPHIWYGYAPDEMMRSAHDQISTCTCGANYPLYNEQATTRVGWSADDAKVLFENEITYGECSATGPTDDDGTQVKCFASTPSVDTNAILEWGGRWSLAKGSYTWTLRAEGNDVDGLEYHEPKMDVFVVKAGSRGDKTSLDVNHRDAQVAISGEDQKKINAGGTIAIAMSKPGMKQTLVLDNSATTTTYKLEIDTDGDYLIYTEHMPWEFAAMVLENTAPANPDARFIWAVEARDYVVTDTQAGVAFNTTIDSGDSGRTVAPITSNTTIDDGSLLKEVSRLENEMKAMYTALAIAKVSKLTCSDGMVQAQDTEAGIGFVCTLPCVAGKDRRDCEDDYCVSNGAAAPNAKKKLVGLYVVIGIVCVVAIVVGVVLKVNGGAEGGRGNIYNSGANQQHHQFANPLAADTPVSSA